MPRVAFEEMCGVLTRALRKLGFEPARAQLCARLFAETSRDGVGSHGINRFSRFVEQVQKGVVDIHASPVPVLRAGAIERWDGRRGPGNLNAYACMERAIALCRENGIGCVALANTNHWMRGGTYGWQAVDAGVIGICWTNTMANLPPWGARKARIGNNPLVIAVPRAEGPVVLDMAMSQFSIGALQSYRARGEELPVDGGFDADGKLTRDAAAIEASRRLLPTGYWKGSGLAVMLDILAAILSGGAATCEIPADPIAETRVSQVFLAIDLRSVDAAGVANEVSSRIVASLRGDGDEEKVRYPGERVLQARRENLELGIPVDAGVWERVLAIAGE
jgi:3-dehydro-L-gulonate 2-dehydrogenase